MAYKDTTNSDSASKLPEVTLIKFSAEYCPPCKALAPVIDSIFDPKEGEDDIRRFISYKKIDIVEEPHAKEKYNISSIPTLMLLVNQEEKERKLGFLQKDYLITWLKKYINQDTI